MLRFLYYYAMGCLMWLVVLSTIQLIARKNLMSNWVYINDITGIEKEKQLQSYPPLDGVIPTIIYCFIPVLNLIYGFFVIGMCFGKQDSNLIIAYQMAARDLKRNEEWEE